MAGAILQATAGCDRTPPAVYVASHLADLVHPKAEGELATHAYPQLSLNGQTRTLLTGFDSDFSGTILLHESLELDVPPGARLEIACAVRPNSLQSGSVRFVINASQDGQSRDLLDQLVALGEYKLGWQEYSIDLSGLEGLVTLDFMTEHTVVPGSRAIANASLGLFSAPVLLRNAKRTRPHVLLVSLDTLRARNLPLYGYDRDTAPFMSDFFSTHGQIVDRAYSPAADTLFGHTAMLYGRDPSALLEKVAPNRLQHIAGAPSLADALRAAGYRTAAFTENANVAAEWGFSRGFEIYDEEKSTGDEPGQGSFVVQTFNRGLEWIARHKDQQLFVFLHTYEVHNPYDPPASTAHLFPTPNDADAARRDLDLYDREIRFTDEQMGRLVAELRDIGVLDNSILIVTSDHGEEFGEHGGRYHNSQTYEEVLRIPFFIHAPGLLPAGAHRNGPIVLQDIYPTLCELLAVSCPTDLDGVNVADHLRSGGPVQSRPFVAEAAGKLRFTYDGLDPNWTPPMNAAVDLPWKLHRKIIDGNYHYELYNLDIDPYERDNRYGESGTPSVRLRALVDGYEARTERQRAALVARYADDAVLPDSSAILESDDAREKKLRALGYLE